MVRFPIISPDQKSVVLILIDPKRMPPPVSKGRIPAKQDRLGTEYVETAGVAAKIVHDFVVAYELTAGRCPDTFGCIGHFREITAMELLTTAVAVKVFSPSGHVFSDEELTSLADHPRPGVSYPLGAMDDLSHESLAQIAENYVLCRDDIFHRFVFESRAAQIEGDAIRALLTACIALEAAHSSLLRSRTALRNPSIDATKRETLIEQVLIKAGISATIELTCAFVLDDKERPPTEVLKAATDALTVRNAIMHAGRKHGRYKVPQYSSFKLDAHARNVLKLVEYFGKAIELDRATAGK